jgi:hypothetical protein
MDLFFEAIQTGMYYGAVATFWVIGFCVSMVVISLSIGTIATALTGLAHISRVLISFIRKNN